MQLTKQTDFAFRTLLALAALKEGELSSIPELCQYYDISHNHLAKVVQRLAKLGYIRATRGKGGGICLAKAPSEINIADVVRNFETQLQAVNCNEPRCAIINHCKLQGVLADAMRAFIKTLENYTLADMLSNSQQGVGLQVLTLE
jgi:Rrf2 family nitric oxide-sensitive transcriptional repressor